MRFAKQTARRERDNYMYSMYFEFCCSNKREKKHAETDSLSNQKRFYFQKNEKR